MWADYVAATGATGPYYVWAFGDDRNPEQQTRLGRLVLEGPKRATAGREDDFSPEGEKLPEPGDLNIIIDGEGHPICVVRTTSVEIRAFGLVDEQFAWDEGEGDRTLAWWRDAHIRFFAGVGTPVDDGTNVVLERFAKVWPPPVDPPEA